MNNIPQAIASLYLQFIPKTYEYGIIDGCSTMTAMGAIIDSKTKKEIISDNTSFCSIGDIVLYESKPFVRNLIRAYEVNSLRTLYYKLHNTSLMKDKKEIPSIISKIDFLNSVGANCDLDDFYVKKALNIYKTYKNN